MKKGRFNKKSFLVVILLLISLGYALLSSNLTINGNSKLASSTWDIHFDNVVPKEGRVSVGENESEAVINPNDNTEVSYNVTLSKPGDFYEFNVDIVNAGSIDGQVEKINSRLKIGDDDSFVINSDSSNLPPYLNYLITYSDDSEIMPNHLLKSGNSETIKVRIEFKRDIDSSILPEDDIDITLTIQPDLIQENQDGYNKEYEIYTPFTYDIDIESVLNTTIQYDKINQEKCVEYFSQRGMDMIDIGTVDIDAEAYCKGEDIYFGGETINFIDELNDSNLDYLQELNDNGVITLKYVGISSYEIDKENCLKTTDGFSEEDANLLCSGGTVQGDISIENVINQGGLDWLIEEEIIKNIVYSEIKPDIIITGYKEEVPSNLVIPREINGKKVVGIADDSFSNKGITSVIIPNTVEYIGSNVFDSNELTLVNISGENVSIGNCAFGNKENIQTHNLPQDYFCAEGCATGSNNLSDGYMYGKGQYNYYYIEAEDGWGVYLADKSSTRPVTSKLCSTLDGKPILSMSDMFKNSNTNSIDFSSFDTSNVKDMYGMFADMYNITELDLSKFNTSNVENMAYMFNNSNSLKTIYVSNSFTTNSVISSNMMFKNNNSLVGGKGTVYNSEYVDIEYAHVDEGVTNPGYFTKKGSLTIKLNPNGGVVDPEELYLDPGDRITDLPVPEKANYEFIGWYSGIEDGYEITSEYVVQNSCEIYARYRDLRKTITFDKNNEDATGVMENQTVLEGAESTLQKNDYLLDEYIFVGWNTKRDGSGVAFLDEDTIVVDNNITLYAQWIKAAVLTFDKNNNNALGENYRVSLLPGDTIEIPDDAFNAYEFQDKTIINYNTDSNYSGYSYTRNDNITVIQDTILYAKWSDTPITETIYWALQDNDNDNHDEKLVISSYPVVGSKFGSFAGDTEFKEVCDDVGCKTSTPNTPWYNDDDYVESIEIQGNVVPVSTAYWFEGVGTTYPTSMYIDLSNLDTKNTTDMNNMFRVGGYYTTTCTLIGINNLDTTNVNNMSSMFSSSFKSVSNLSIDLSNWDVSNVNNMSYMFLNTGYNSTTFNLDLSTWNTSQVTSISRMFDDTGYNATTWNVKIPQTNGGGINNQTDKMFGKTSSVYARPNSGRQFTLVAN